MRDDLRAKPVVWCDTLSEPVGPSFQNASGGQEELRFILGCFRFSQRAARLLIKQAGGLPKN
jgi:hypothetical protein